MKARKQNEDEEPAPQSDIAVLIVDDDEDLRSAHVRALNLIHPEPGKRIHAISAADAKDALELLKTHKIDCCMVDYMMPGTDGLELQHEILNRYPDMAVIVLTGKGSEDLAARAIKEGAMDYIVKGTVSVAHLEAAIFHSVNRARLSKALEMQRRELLAAERQRVMLQSLGTACHHVSQPLTVLRTYIAMLKRNEKSRAQKAVMEKAFNACHELCEIIWRISDTSTYMTEPYRNLDGKHPDGASRELVALFSEEAMMKRAQDERSEARTLRSFTGEQP